MQCDDPYGHDTICHDMCYPGCVCKRGFARSEKEKCIQISECPGFIGRLQKTFNFQLILYLFFTACPNPHEIHLTRHYNCRQTCQNPYGNDDECVFEPPGCFCDFDTLKDEITGECKPKQECREKAGPNQTPIKEKII